WNGGMPGEDELSVSGSTGREARREAAQVLRRFLATVESGELDANSAHAKALLRRIEGAVVGLETDERDFADPMP
ncbi:MAG: hypothetical protein M3256_15775, partial [Actinomycetota bacterium]|nr:hypothetical protein [Actinomycetota bacterium]